MEENNITKISLSTFFLIIAIITICVMGYFIYISNSKIKDMKLNEKDLNNKISELEDKSEQNNVNSSTNEEKTFNQSPNVSNNENNITYSNFKGKYIANLKNSQETTQDVETKVILYLYENGNYNYNNIPGTDAGHVGYYTISGNNLILHEILACANDIGRKITSDTITLKINNDNTITDNTLNVTLKKASIIDENDYDLITTELKNALNNNSLS